MVQKYIHQKYIHHKTIMVLEKTLQSSLDCKEIKPVNPEEKPALNILWKD